jgi:hypothetical protein
MPSGVGSGTIWFHPPEVIIDGLRYRHATLLNAKYAVYLGSV